jgi:FixJ family two-component response regulator
MTTQTITQLHQDVLDVLRSSPSGCTDHEIAAALGLNVRTANMRRLWLLRHALVEFAGCQDTGAAVKRTVWRCIDG